MSLYTMRQGKRGGGGEKMGGCKDARGAKWGMSVCVTGSHEARSVSSRFLCV